MMVLSLWDMSIESIDGVGHFRAAHKDIFPKILSGRKVGTPPLGVTLKKVRKKLYMHAVWLPTCSSDGPMAMGVVLYINTNDPGHSITSFNTSVDVLGLPGAPTGCRHGWLPTAVGRHRTHPP